VNTRITTPPVVRNSVCEAALEVLPDIVLIHDEQRIIFTNAACRRVLGASRPEDLEGRPLEIIVHPDGREAGKERRRILMNGDRSLRSIPIKLVALDGATKHLTVDAHPLNYGGVRAGMVVASTLAD
jgi:PAS domain S-box-containing protein